MRAEGRRADSRDFAELRRLARAVAAPNSEDAGEATAGFFARVRPRVPQRLRRPRLLRRLPLGSSSANATLDRDALRAAAASAWTRDAPPRASGTAAQTARRARRQPAAPAPSFRPLPPRERTSLAERRRSVELATGWHCRELAAAEALSEQAWAGTLFDPSSIPEP